MNPTLGWALAAIFTFLSWRVYGLPGLALAASTVVFWLLLTFNRAVRVMKNAAGAPVGHVPSAVMFHAGLKRGMTMLQIVSKTKSLGKKLGAGDDDWAWRDEGGREVSVHLQRGRVERWAISDQPAEQPPTAAEA